MSKRQVRHRPKVGDFVVASFEHMLPGKKRISLVLNLDDVHVTVAPLSNPDYPPAPQDFLFDAATYGFLKYQRQLVQISQRCTMALADTWQLLAARPDFAPALTPDDRKQLEIHLAYQQHKEAPMSGDGN